MGEGPSAARASGSSNTPSVASSSNAPKGVPTLGMPTRTSHPNRSFSSTTLVGNVPVVVFLPGMDQPISHPAVPKRQHTRLPHHRPPLRRDKPVRISVPGQPPRYIFPSTERSFIFIPRALRPNQQSYRGRGRGGFYGGRRPNFYMNTGYTPGIPASRRSSIGRTPAERFSSPAAPIYARPTGIVPESGKPIVRLPPIKPPTGMVGPRSSAAPITTEAIPPPSTGVPPPIATHPLPQDQHPTYRESRPAPIPMHQPRPQKAVSVADIESPASFLVNPPQPQQEQPFHQQVPVPVNGPIYGGPDNSVIPMHGSRRSSHAPMAPQLSHIPERAIHAQPFQPYGFQQPQGFYPAQYPPSAAYYPTSGPEYPPYNNTMGSGYPPPAQQYPYMMPPPPASVEPPPTGTIAHEAGGTVYFYDTNQMAQNAQFPFMPPVPAGGIVGGGRMMTPPGTTYYPQPNMYYPIQ